MDQDSSDTTTSSGYYARRKYAEQVLTFPDLSPEDIARMTPILETFFEKVLDNLFVVETKYEKSEE